MDENVKDLLTNTKNPEEAIRIAEEYGYNVEIKNNNDLLNDDDLENVSGGATYSQETYASYSVVVRDKNTGEILCVIPY